MIKVNIFLYFAYSCCKLTVKSPAILFEPHPKINYKIFDFLSWLIMAAPQFKLSTALGKMQSLVAFKDALKTIQKNGNKLPPRKSTILLN